MVGSIMNVRGRSTISPYSETTKEFSLQKSTLLQIYEFYCYLLNLDFDDTYSLFIDNSIVSGGDFGDTYCVCSIQYIKLLTLKLFNK